jgi:SSS family solute:Na+ symporter
VVFISGVISMGIAVLYVNAGNEGVLGIVFTLYAIFSGGIVGIFLLGLLVPRANNKGVKISVFVCILFTAYAVLTSVEIGVGDHKSILLDLGRFNYTHNKLMLGVYSHLIVIIVGYGASLFFPKVEVDKRLLYSGWLELKRADRKAAKISN